MTSEELLDLIDEMLEDERFTFASDTLSGIRAMVKKTGVATERQEQAIKNIRASKSDEGERGEKKWNRRYEGR